MTINGTSTRPPKAALLVAQRIVQDALREGRKPGDLLAPERTMLEKYQTGRGTLREALRLLEFQGVITLKPGPRGGPVLMDPDASHLASNLVLLMQLKAAPFRNIVEVRTAMEPMISSLAAERMDDDALTDLEGTIIQMREEIEDQHSFLDANKRFHDIIAWSSGNALFGYIVTPCSGSWTAPSSASTTPAPAAPPSSKPTKATSTPSSPATKPSPKPTSTNTSNTPNANSPRSSTKSSPGTVP